MDMLFDFIPKLGQFFVGIFFIIFGFLNIANRAMALAYLQQKRIPFPLLSLVVGISWQLVFGFMLIFNIYPKFAALMLIPFDIVAVIIFHPFWERKDEARFLNRIIFISNLTVVLGALLLLLSTAQPIRTLSDLFY